MSGVVRSALKMAAIAGSALLMVVNSAGAISKTPDSDKDYITGYVGYFDIVRNKQEAAQFGLEYRARPLQYGVRPMVGINVTSDSAVYGYGGINWDVPLIDKKLYLIPNFAVGAYSQGNGRNLGGAIEFRSGIELAYQFQNSQRLGLAFNHISNASIYYHNPGSETLLLSYSVPLGIRW